MTMKKIILFSLLGLLLSIKINATVDVVSIYSGKCGHMLTWTLNTATGELRISGRGEMDKYLETEPAPWEDYKYRVKSIVIENGVTSIGSYAFSHSDVEHVSIPKTVKHIGAYSFEWCSRLKTIVIPEGVEIIYNNAFYYSELESITLPSSLKDIYWDAFSYANLKYEIVDGVKYIGNWAMGVTNTEQTEYTVREGTIGLYQTFEDCRVKKVNLPSSLKTITDASFSGCYYLDSINIPHGVQSIGKYAFKGCYKLASVSIPNSVTYIGDYAFESCGNLVSVTIPNSVTYIGDGAFEDCSKLVSVTMPDSVTYIGNYAFRNCSKLASVTMPDSVRRIGADVFYNSPNIEYEIVDGVKYLGNWAVGITDKNQTEYTLKEGTVGLCDAFKDSKIKKINLPSSLKIIGDNAFYNCIALDTVIVPDGFKDFGESAFMGSGLDYINIPQSVERIEDNAFRGSSIDTLYIPNSVQKLGEGICSFCKSLRVVTFPSNTTGISLYSCSSLSSVTIHSQIPPHIESNAFYMVPQKCVLTVPEESVKAYSSLEYRKFEIRGIDLSSNLDIVDGKEDVIQNAYICDYDKISYTRTLPNLLWNPLYVPFEIPYSELSEKYDIAYINAIHSYDRDDNGTIDDLTMEVVKIKSGNLKANYPYVIRAKNEESKEMSIVLENTYLHETKDVTIDCSSVLHNFEVSGAYSRKTASELDGKLAISTEGAWQPLASGTSLNPFRLYLTVSNREGSPVKMDADAMSRVNIRAFDEDDVTGIEEIEDEGGISRKKIYDLSGRPIQTPTKGGIYLVNGKKIVY